MDGGKINMFNSTYNSYHAGNHSTTNNLHINAITGAILKNHPKSWFEKFHLNSPRANELFERGGHRGYRIEKNPFKNYLGETKYHEEKVYDKEKDVVVLQMVICGDMEVLAEIVWAKDLNESLCAQEEEKR